mmetsp:Transcript_97694/g.276354  ORF Transcript_97694/g.276354 Transcript_97694/m.276354 type:complete len:242 (+) Transcript_97694:299-1024(+)
MKAGELNRELRVLGGQRLQVLLGDNRIHHRLQPRARRESDTSLAIAQHREMQDFLLVQRVLHSHGRRLHRQNRRRRQQIQDISRQLMLHSNGRLSRQERNGFPCDLLLVEATMQENLVQNQRNRDTQHQGRPKAKVAARLDDEHDDGHGDLLEAAKHCCAAHHRVDAARGEAFYRRGPHQSSYQAAHEAANEHRPREIARRHGNASHPHVQDGVCHKGQEAVARVDVARILPREQPLDRTL